MKEFRVQIPNKPGTLAQTTEMLAEKGVNLRSIAGVDAIGTAVAIVPDREDLARQALNELGFQFKETDLLTVTLEDKPGQLQDVARTLGDAGVNIDSVYLLTRAGAEVELGLTVTDLDQAQQALNAD